MVQIAEFLIGKGYDLRILDPAIETTRLTGANRQYIERHIPHLASRLVRDADELLDHSEVVVLAREDGAALRDRIRGRSRRFTVVNLTGRIPTQLERPRAERRRSSRPGGAPPSRLWRSEPAPRPGGGAEGRPLRLGRDDAEQGCGLNAGKHGSDVNFRTRPAPPTTPLNPRPDRGARAGPLAVVFIFQCIYH